MKYPEFFDTLPAIALTDPLSDILGTFEDGAIVFSYLDVVKGSGHSCPTVAGAYLISYHAIKSLYPQGLGVRGDISVQFAQDLEEGTTGVVSNVIAYITGATDKSGFKGLNGKFARHGLIHFKQDVPSIRFSRTDTNKSVDIFYDPSSIPPDPRQMQLMPTILAGKAGIEEKKEFGTLWQERVKKILVDNFQNAAVIRVVDV